MSIIYCSSYATAGLNDGSDWENAFINIIDAFNYSNSNTNTTINIDNNIYTITNFTFINDTTIIGGNNILNNINGYNFTTIDFNIINNINKLNLNNIEFKSSNIGTSFVNTTFASTIIINNCIIYSINGISDGSIIINNSQLFSQITSIVTNNYIYIKNSYIKSNNGIILNDGNAEIYDSVIYSNNGIKTNIISFGTIIIKNSLLKSTDTALDINISGILYMNDCTIDSTTALKLSNTYIQKSEINNSIILGLNIITNSGLISNNSVYSNLPLNINNGNIELTKTPYFKNRNMVDYTPLFGIGETLESFELTKKNINYITNVDAQKLNQNQYNISNYKYLVNNIFVLSDYMKEIEFANLILNHGNLIHSIKYKKEVIKKNMITSSSFPYTNISGETVITWPYEWDYVNLNDYIVGGNKNYIIPRSIIDITEIINNEFMFNPDLLTIEKFEAITLKEKILKGIAHDYLNSTSTNIALWTLDNNQQLKLKNIYDNVDVNTYNLLSKEIPKDQHYFIKPSGLLPFGQVNDGYLYQVIGTNKQIKGATEYFDFEWLPTDINNNYKLNGMVVYKDNLYIVGKYTIDNTNIILSYSTKSIYTDFISNNPNIYKIGNDFEEFTDITILEDGSFLLSSNNSKMLYNYKLKYDYAKISNTTVTDTIVILRENYNNITLSGIL